MKSKQDTLGMLCLGGMLVVLIGCAAEHSASRTPRTWSRGERVALDAAEATQIVASSGSHTCALLAEGTTKCWGYNLSGQLGDGTRIDRPVPTSVGGLGDVTQLAAGMQHTCALLSEGTVTCWGYNFGLVPTRVRELTDAVQLVAGGYHTCALLSDGTAMCWGFNGSGQLGDGTKTDRFVPTQVRGLRGATQLAAGANHTCAVLADGTAKCWGFNEYGQIGDGTGGRGMERVVPTQVGGLASVTQLSAGLSHTCALLTDGTAKCWGIGRFGELGDGSFPASRYLPVPVVSLVGATQLTAGGSHTCALLADGTAKCWGANWSGQTGEGPGCILLGFGSPAYTSDRSASSSSAGTGPIGIVAGDYNRDGKADLVTANRGGNDLTILLGNGDGSFKPPTAFGLGATTPGAIGSADFNADGTPDIAVARDGVSVHIAKGDGTFADAVPYAAGSNAVSLAIADVDGDGKLDLVLGSDKTIRVLLGKGDGTFGAPTSVTIGSLPNSLVAADVDLDGKTDLVSMSLAGTEVLLGKGAVTFGAPIVTAAARGDRGDIADFNRDGIPDVAVRTATEIRIARGVGDGTFGPDTVYPVESWGAPTTLIASDVRRTGRPDVVSTNGKGTGRVHLLMNGHP